MQPRSWQGDSYKSRTKSSAARREAFAERLAPQAIPEQADEIERRDRWVASFARGLARPPLQVRTALLLIRLGERRSVAEVIDILGALGLDQALFSRSRTITGTYEPSGERFG